MSRSVILSLALSLSPCVTPTAFTQCEFFETQKVSASDVGIGGWFGDQVAMDDDLAVVTRRFSNEVYVFRFMAGQWVEEAKLAPTPSGSAWSVAVDDDRILLGSRSRPGLLYHFDGATWALAHTLTPNSSGSPSTEHVDLCGDVLAVANPFDDEGFIFEYDGSSWIEVAHLEPSNPAGFGLSVAATESVVVVGSREQAHVYRKVGGSWSLEQVLLDSTANTDFGFECDVEGDLLAVSAKRDDTLAKDAGAVRLYQYDGNGWSLLQSVTASDGAVDDQLGFGVALKDGLLVAGALNGDGVVPNAAAAYVYQDAGGLWVQVQKMIASDGAPVDIYGETVATAKGRVMVGAAGNDQPFLQAGAAYSYDVPDLALCITPSAVGVGDTLNEWFCGGLPGGLVALYAVDVNGTPFFLRLKRATFGADGSVLSTGVVPPGLTGVTVTMIAFGVKAPGKVGASNPSVVTFL